MDVETIFKVLAAAPAAIAGVVAFFKERREKLAAAATLSQATARVTFWKLLLEAQALALLPADLEIAKARAKTHLTHAALSIEEAETYAKGTSTADMRPESKFRRLFFLYRPPARWLWLLRGYYLLSVLVSSFSYTYIYLRGKDLPATLAGEEVLWIIIVWWIIRYIENKIWTRLQRRAE